MERHCHDWILSMTERDCTVNVITMPPQNFSQFPNSVRFFFIPGQPSRKVLQRITHYPNWVGKVGDYLQKFLKEESVDAIYAHGLAAAACDSVSVPMFYNPHGMEEFKTSGLKFMAYSVFRSMSRKAAAHAVKVIATDKSLVLEIQKYLKIRDQKIALIPNSVRVRRGGAKTRPENLKSADPLLLSVGRLEQNKGFHILLKALAQTNGLPPGWHLIVAGSGSMAKELQNIVSSSGINSHVTFASQTSAEDMDCLYQIADIFIHPSLYEGSSIVTLEAMMNGLPVIATTVGGLPDKVHPENGWLVPPNDVTALSKAIIQACETRDKWKQMGEASRRIVQEEFTWDRAAELFLATFRERQ
jgi:glycosyltransferase involved in cell wall biosynthesis